MRVELRYILVNYVAPEGMRLKSLFLKSKINPADQGTLSKTFPPYQTNTSLVQTIYGSLYGRKGLQYGYNFTGYSQCAGQLLSSSSAAVKFALTFKRQHGLLLSPFSFFVVLIHKSNFALRGQMQALRNTVEQIFNMMGSAISSRVIGISLTRNGYQKIL